jgi:curved DNA-binding protein
MTPGSEIRTETHARAILKLAAGDPPSTWRAAFQREVKAAHPDQGGDSERVRLVIEAYRYLKTQDLSGSKGSSGREPPPRPKPQPRPSQARSQDAKPQPRAGRPEPPPRPRPEVKPEPPPEPPPPSAKPKADPPIRISIVEAFRGTDRLVRLTAGKKFKVRLPAGLQTGDVVRFGSEGQHRLTIAVEAMEKAELKGADLWLTVGVSAEFLKEGGRVEIDTPLGGRKFWVSRTSAARGVYRAPGEGLPARSGRDKGHLFMRFELDVSLNRSPSKSLLARFAAVWAAE